MQVRISFHCTCEESVDVKYETLKLFYGRKKKGTGRKFEYAQFGPYSVSILLLTKKSK